MDQLIAWVRSVILLMRRTFKDEKIKSCVDIPWALGLLIFIIIIISLHYQHFAFEEHGAVWGTEREPEWFQDVWQLYCQAPVERDCITWGNKAFGWMLFFLSGGWPLSKNADNTGVSAQRWWWAQSSEQSVICCDSSVLWRCAMDYNKPQLFSDLLYKSILRQLMAAIWK